MSKIVKSPLFVITKNALSPNEAVNVPFGKVLMAGFDGDEAWAWIEHSASEQRAMQLIVLPTGGPFELETDADLFFDAQHVTSFFKTVKRTIVGKGVPKNHTSAWHVFAWLPKPVNVLIPDVPQTEQ